MFKTLADDVLTTLLRALRLRVRLMARADYCGQWALQSGRVRADSTFHYVGRGECWLHCGSREQALVVRAGHLVFFPRPQWHQFSSTPEVQPGPAPGDMAVPGMPAVTIICCIVEFESSAHQALLHALPDLLLLDCAGAGVSAELATLAQLMLREHDAESAGHGAMIELLAEALFIEILRHQMCAADGLRGVLRGLADPHLAPALTALHEAPGRNWNVEDLAGIARLSRSAFARRFNECMDQAPMQYLVRWRMHLADQMLRDPRQSVAKVAEQLGYGTETAFRHAFKRVRGVGPGQVRRAVELN